MDDGTSLTMMLRITTSEEVLEGFKDAEKGKTDKGTKRKRDEPYVQKNQHGRATKKIQNLRKNRMKEKNIYW